MVFIQSKEITTKKAATMMGKKYFAQSFLVYYKRAMYSYFTQHPECERVVCQNLPLCSFNLTIDCLVCLTHWQWLHSILLLLFRFPFFTLSILLSVVLNFFLLYFLRLFSISFSPFPSAFFSFSLSFHSLFMFCVHIFRHGWIRDRGVDSHDRLDIRNGRA